MKFLISLITALVVTVNSGLTSANRFIDKLASKNTKKIVVLTKEKPSSEENSPSVLGVETQNDDIDSVTFNVNTIFKNGIKVRQGADLSSLTASSIDLGSGQIRAGNILYGVVGGDGIVISSGQTPIISLSLAGGDGIKIDGNKIVNTGIIGLSAGVGISVSGSSITNIDPGSSQNIFKTISVAGQDDIVADKNDDTLTLTAGTGISILTDPTNDKLTFFSNDPSIAAGWTHGVDSIFLTNLTDNVGIGIEDPSAKLEVVGSVKFSGGLNNSSGGIINAGSITGATGFTSSGTITLADLSTGIVHSNIYGVLSSSAVNLANTDVTGILPVAHGGLGLTSVTTGGIVYGSSPNIYSVLGAGGEGEVLTMSSGIPSWATVTGAGGICANCLINNPGSNQTITPADTSATGLIVKQASGGLVDIFKVTDSTGSTAYLRVDSSGNVLLGNGQTTQGIFTVSPSGSHAMSISPSSTVGTPHTGTMTSEDLTENRTWTFPDQSGIICTTAGNCSGTSSAIGGNGSLGYLSKWSGTYALTNSLLYDNGINVGIGTTIPGYKLDINGSLRATGQTLLDNTLTVSNTATMSSALYVKGPASLSSTLGVTGATTLSSTLGVTGNAIFNGNMGIGTSSPLTPLHIGTTPGDYRANPTLSFGDGDTGIYEQSDDVLGFATGDGYRMFISSIGIFNPASTGTLLISNSAGSSTNPLYSFYADSNTGIGYPGADSISLIAGGSSKLVATTTGVGIGTTSPQRTLDVSSTGNITFGDAVSTGSNERGIYWFSGNDYGIYRASGSWATLPKLNIAFNTGFNFSTGSPNTPKLTLSNTGGLSLGNSYTATDPGAGNMIISGNVGIGTTAPGYKLEVNGGSVYTSGSVTAHTSLVSHDIVSTERIFRYSDGDLSINNSWAGRNIGFTTKQAGGTTNSNQLYLQSTGNVGIGTTSPGQKLHLVGGDGSSPATSGTTQAGASLRIQYPSNNTAFDMGTMSSGGAWMQVTNATNLGLNYKLLLNPNGGNVGIGTTSPGASLHIVNTADNQLRIGNTSGYYFDFGRNNTSGFLSIQGNQTGYNSILLAPTSGNVGIGTSNPSYKLDVAGTLNTTGATTLGSTLDVSGLTTITGTSGSNALQINRSGAEVLGILTGTNYANLNLVDSSTEPTNLLTNSTFNSDLTSWSEVPSYTLNDQFTTNRAAGAVNGTSAEPTGGTRTVVDTGSKLSITSSNLNVTGGTGGGWNGPGLWYPSLSRAAGKIIVGKLNFSDITTDKRMIFGFSNLASGMGTASKMIGLNINYNSAGALTSVKSGENIGTIAASTDYLIASVLRSTGAYYYIKGGTYTNWTLLYIDPVDSTSTLYPYIYNNSAIFTADNIRIPSSTWLPTPLAYDTFTRADGAIGSSETTGPDSQTTPSLAWTGGAISTNKNVITPTLGSELITDNDMEAVGVTNWSSLGTPLTKEKSTEQVHGGTQSLKMITDANEEAPYQSNSISIGTWYSASAWTYITGGTVTFAEASYGQMSQIATTTMNTWVPINRAFRGKNATAALAMYSGAGSSTYYIDDVSFKPLTLSSLFSTVSTSDSDVIADAGVTMTAGTQAGIVTNLDSTSSPANFLIAYHDGTNVKLDKNVGGTYTNLISAAATYSAGATLRVITYHSDANTLKVRVYYNNAMIGSEQTVTNAGIISNTKHGLFSTYSGNSFDNFTLFARGSDGEYGEAPFEELTVSRDTTTKYAGTASAKLVAGGTAGNYLQSVNVGDTSTYNLIAYAYTDGSAVTTDDVNLYYDTAELATSFTPMGGTGWYKLTGSFTGVASAKDYGVRVKAGKTVYIDNMKVQQGTATTQTMYVTNSGTGVTNLNVQGLINGTQNGIATYVKAGTISDSDFTTATNGLMAIDSTNGRLYLRSGGSWNYIAFTGGFQIPANEAGDLEDGELLLPYVEKKMSDGALHGLYKKFSDVVVGGNATIPTFSDTVDVVFDKPFTDQPVVTFSLMIDSNNTTFIKEGQQAYLQDVSKDGFTLKLPELSPRDFTYTWTAVAVPKMTITRGKSLIQGLINNQGQSSGSASISPTPTLTPTPSEPTKSPTPTPTVTVTPTVSPSPTP